MGRAIPIIGDAYADPEKGTGAVKITPAHDFNDFAVGQRHDLPMPSVLDRQAMISLDEIEDVLTQVPGIADPAFVRGLAGTARFAARAMWSELERLGLLDKVEPHTQQVPHGDRGGVPVEPRLTTQWYCNAATLAKPAIEAVETGKTVFVPKQWENTFFAWMRDIQPWCISRQLWWGHRIPAWYGPDGTVFVAHDVGGAASRRAIITATTNPCNRMRTFSIPGSVRHCGHSPPSAGRNRRPNSIVTIPVTCWSPASTSSSSGSPA